MAHLAHFYLRVVKFGIISVSSSRIRKLTTNK
nr:MAG TPA: hypothetical protein [Caudoviricetes sp.]DAR41774.1 MAG TPA: hypothetical protein [Caudoviricetes sp.]